MAEARGDAGTERRVPAWVRVLEILAVVVILAVVGRYLWIQFEQLDLDKLHFRTARILLSLALVVAAYLLTALVIGGFFGALGHPLGPRRALAVALVPGLAKYLPGKVHSSLGMVWLAHRLAAVPARAGFAVAVLVYLQAAVVGVVCAALLAPFGSLAAAWKLLLAVLAVMGLAALHPAICLRPINWLLGWLRRRPLDIPVRYRRVVGLTLIVVVQSLIAAATFVLLASGLVDLPPGSEGYLAFSFILAALLGFVAFFAPAGIGVQEGALVLLLGQVLPADQAAMLAVATRIWQTCMVVAGAGIGGLALVRLRPAK